MIYDCVGTPTFAILLVTDMFVFAKVVRISPVKATDIRTIIDSEIIPPVIVLYSSYLSNLSIRELLKKSLAVNNFLIVFRIPIFFEYIIIFY